MRCSGPALKLWATCVRVFLVSQSGTSLMICTQVNSPIGVVRAITQLLLVYAAYGLA